MRLFAIWDIDNCVANDAHRIPYIDWANPDPDARYEPYHQRMSLDHVGNLAVFRAVCMMAEPVFFTARPHNHEVGTRLWLEANLHVNHNVRMYMREPGDHRPSVQLKHHMLCRFRTEAQTRHLDCQIVAFDDRQEVVDMYIREGVRAMRLPIHDVCAYTNPISGEVSGVGHVTMLTLP